VASFSSVGSASFSSVADTAFDEAVTVLEDERDWPEVEAAVWGVWIEWGEVFDRDAQRGFRDPQSTVYAALSAVDILEETVHWNRQTARAELKTLLSRERSVQLRRRLRPNLSDSDVRARSWIVESYPVESSPKVQLTR